MATMPEIRVRAAEPADAQALYEIFNSPAVAAQTLQTPYQSVDQIRERFAAKSPDVCALVAELEGRVVGTLGLHLESNPRRHHTGAIGMAVHERFQNQGVGSTLVAAALDLADNWLNLRRLELQVYTDNTAAIHLYKKFGFEIEGTLRDYAFRNGEYVDAYAMARLRE
jgi:putative acetyltransferase